MDGWMDSDCGQRAPGVYHLRHVMIQFDYDSVCYALKIHRIGSQIVKFHWSEICKMGTNFHSRCYNLDRYCTSNLPASGLTRHHSALANNCHLSALSN